MTREAAVKWLVSLVSPIPLTPSDLVPKVERYGDFCHFLCSPGGLVPALPVPPVPMARAGTRVDLRPPDLSNLCLVT